MSADSKIPASLEALISGRAELPPFTVRPSGRARRLTLRVYPGGRVEVTVPPWARPDEVARFVVRHRAWIETRVERLRAEPAAGRAPLPERLQLPALGDEWEIRYAPRGRDGFRVVAPRILEVYGDPSAVSARRRSLRRWLGEEARVALGAWLADVASETGLGYERVQVRRQRTRWGSCSRSGTISLNVCLLFQPPEVVRYLLVHELCHTVEMNHSDRFWGLVERHEPDYRALDRLLSKGWQCVPDWLYA
jgi:predicted metal-dependent hydrolase